MIRPCQNTDCGASFAEDMRLCPVCGTANDRAEVEHPAVFRLSFKLRIGQFILLAYLFAFLLLELCTSAIIVDSGGPVRLPALGMSVFWTVLLGSWLYHGSLAARSVVIFVCLVGGAWALYLLFLGNAAASTDLQLRSFYFLSFALVLLLPTSVTKFLTYQRH